VAKGHVGARSAEKMRARIAGKRGNRAARFVRQEAAQAWRGVLQRSRAGSRREACTGV